mmetsp:Transcript_11875/g.25053  ORF Transcript_11875/g.25053 Transcript_11875/m.25053 type:complete len:155 (-) Transcript_11875:259-723(-)
MSDRGRVGCQCGLGGDALGGGESSSRILRQIDSGGDFERAFGAIVAPPVAEKLRRGGRGVLVGPVLAQERRGRGGDGTLSAQERGVYGDQAERRGSQQEAEARAGGGEERSGHGLGMQYRKYFVECDPSLGSRGADAAAWSWDDAWKQCYFYFF